MTIALVGDKSGFRGMLVMAFICRWNDLKSIMILKKLIPLFLFFAILFASGGYDHGTSAGKGNWDISLTWNPFNYFEQGQSYAVFGYGLTERLDIHGYYSYTQRGNDNYYGGFSYQFYKSNRIDLSTAIGVRKYRNENTTHIFSPQLLYTVRLSDRIGVGGSFVNIKGGKIKDKSEGVAKDVFLMVKIFESIKYKIDITVGGFNPVLWEPESGNWYPTYSLDIKLKR